MMVTFNLALPWDKPQISVGIMPASQTGQGLQSHLLYPQVAGRWRSDCVCGQLTCQLQKVMASFTARKAFASCCCGLYCHCILYAVGVPFCAGRESAVPAQKRSWARAGWLGRDDTLENHPLPMLFQHTKTFWKCIWVRMIWG